MRLRTSSGDDERPENLNTGIRRYTHTDGTGFYGILFPNSVTKEI